ncbi:MAG: hypothetical protein AB7O26_12990, partial [Planctomycetaceae bacterium]
LLPLLNEPNVVRHVPIPILIQCATLLGNDRLPRPAAAQIGSSLFAIYDLRFGRDDVVLTASPTWQLQDAPPMQLTMGTQTFTQPEVTSTPARTQIRFRNVAEFGHPLQTVPDRGETILTVKYHETSTLQLRLRPSYDPSTTVGMPVSYNGEANAGRRNMLHVSEIVANGSVIALRSPRSDAPSAPSRELESPKDSSSKTDQPTVTSPTEPKPSESDSSSEPPANEFPDPQSSATESDFPSESTGPSSSDASLREQRTPNYVPPMPAEPLEPTR